MKFLKILLFCLSWAVAVPFYGNQSHIQWKTVESDHFRVHYPVEYQSQVGAMVLWADAVRDSVVNRYRVAPAPKVDLVVRNALFSNGFANPVHNLMNIWLTDWDNKTRSTHSWLSDVVTHEFSHLVSIQAGAKLSPWIQALQVSYQDFYNDPVQNNWALAYPTLLYPLWFAEGTAQYESARLGFDTWDSHRDMLLRVAVLEDKLLPLPMMNEFAPHALQAEQGPYNQGFALVLYLAEKYGDQVIPKLWSELGQLHRVTMSGALERVVGISEKDLYAQWKSAQILHYQGVKDRLGALHTGKKLSAKSFWHDFVQWDQNVLYGVTNLGSAWFEGQVFALEADSVATRSASETPIKANLHENLAQQYKLHKPWLEKGLSIKNGRIAYVTYEKRDRAGRAYFDIAVDDTSKSKWNGQRPGRKLLTEFADAVYPDLSPDGQQVVLVRRESQGSRFVLAKVAVGSSSEPAPLVDLLLPPADALEYNFYTPRWSPDGSKIAFSFFDGRRRQVGVVDSAGTTFTLIASGDFDARDPVWTADGAGLIVASDANGIFNLWRYDLADLAHPRPLTNVVGGAFNPAVRNDSLLTYVGYDADGFSLYEINYARTNLTALTQVNAPRIVARPNFEAKELHGVQRDYRGIPSLPVLLPLLSIESHSDEVNLGIFKGKSVYKAGFAMGLSDPLEKNQIEMALLLQVGRGWDWIDQSGLNPDLHSDLLVNWVNRNFPWTWGLGFYRSNVSTRDTVRYEDPRSYDDSLGISAMGISFQVLQADMGYSVFKQGDTVQLSAASQSARFNLFEDGFAWDYLQRKQLSLFTGWVGEGGADMESNIAGSGNGIWLGALLAQSNLFRPGTFRESFTVSAQGAITPVYRVFNTQEFIFSSWWSWAVPWHRQANLALGARVSGVMGWQGKSAATDTLDHFFHHTLAVSGYPVLANSENYAIHGDRTAHLQAYYLFPLWNEMGLSWWIGSLKSLWGSVFAQAGNGWWDETPWRDQLVARQAWKRSVGLEMRLSASLFRQLPLEISVNFAKALDDISLSHSRLKVATLGGDWLPAVLQPTTMGLNVGFQFNNPWQGLSFNRYRAPYL